MPHARLALATGFGLLALAACGDDPVNFSEPVTINLKAKSSDTVNDVVSSDKNITTESGNPYGKFVADARAALGGVDPTRIALGDTTLTLGAGSTGVLGLGEVFTGDVEVVFQVSDTNNSYPAARGAIAATAAAGPITLPSSFSTDPVSTVDFAKLLGGNFKVVLRGPAATGFAAKGASADLQVTLSFAAYE